jgi:hypothetical protein
MPVLWQKYHADNADIGWETAIDCYSNRRGTIGVHAEEL